MSLRERVPWWGRIGGKLILARLPFRYEVWRRINVFRHGAMIDPAYALRVFRLHFASARLPVGAPFTALELGPGDSLASMIIAAAHGASRTYLIDSGAFATMDLAVYQSVCRHLLASGLPHPDLREVHDTATLMRVCGGVYGTRGLLSLRELPAASVHFAWSQSTLEHVRRDDFEDIIRETRRVLRDDGICSHHVDLRDHLGGALNNLRIPSRVWEAEWMARSGFYTNRLRLAEIIAIFQRAGFRVVSLDINRWQQLPTPVAAFAAEFRDCDPEDLLVQSFRIAVRPA